ncbi:MAG: molybdenum cofactor guanylyltransferase [Dehalococcoidia bacterium]|nr:molybdenum cofactor guanylyltransferase [Dehalococcoidia bacterium]
MGTDKAQLKLNGAQTLLENAVSRMKCLSTDVIVVSDVIRVAGAHWVKDALQDGGPLGGLYSGLLAARFSHCLAVACDMPFLNLRLLRYMAEQPRDYDVLIPRLGEQPLGSEMHPLHAIYATSCLSVIKMMLDAGLRSLRDIYPRVKTVYLKQEDITCFDPDGLSFFNINTPQDMVQAQALLKDRPWL